MCRPCTPPLQPLSHRQVASVMPLTLVWEDRHTEAAVLLQAQQAAGAVSMETVSALPQVLSLPAAAVDGQGAELPSTQYVCVCCT